MLLVTFQVTRLCELLSTRVARVRLLTGVDSHVSLQVDELCKALGAVRTSVQLYVVVDHHVPFEVEWVTW